MISNFKNSLHYNRGRQEFSTTYSYSSNKSKNTLSFGYIENNLKSHQLNFIHKLHTNWLFDLNSILENKISISENFESKNYNLDESTAEKIKPLIKNFEITVFMGTWCEESQKDIPGFFKLYDYIKADNEKIQLIGMSEQKTTPQNYEKGLEIFNVPTYIFKKNGKEINRIVEFPVETLEKDIFKILSGQEYKNIYADF